MCIKHNRCLLLTPKSGSDAEISVQAYGCAQAHRLWGPVLLVVPHLHRKVPTLCPVSPHEFNHPGVLPGGESA